MQSGGCGLDCPRSTKTGIIAEDEHRKSGHRKIRAAAGREDPVDWHADRAAVRGRTGGRDGRRSDPGRADRNRRRGWRNSASGCGAGRTRTGRTIWMQERRNVFCVTLDLSKPRGREIFLKLVARAEIWMESSKPGTCGNGVSTTPRYGRSTPSWSSRTSPASGKTATRFTSRAPSYDIVGQAVGGMMDQTGFPDPTRRRAPRHGPVTTSPRCSALVVAGRTDLRARPRQGPVDRSRAVRGDSRTLGGTMVEYFRTARARTLGQQARRASSRSTRFQASDGWVVMGATRRSLYATATRHRARSRRPQMGKRAHQTRIDRRRRVRCDPARMDVRAHLAKSCASQAGAGPMLAHHDEQGHRKEPAIQGPRDPCRMGGCAGRARQGHRSRPQILADARQNLARPRPSPTTTIASTATCSVSVPPTSRRSAATR